MLRALPPAPFAVTARRPWRGRGLPLRKFHLASAWAAAPAVRWIICDRVCVFAAFALVVVPTVPVIGEMIGSVTPFLTLTICALGTMTAVALVLAYSLTYVPPWLGRHLATIAGDLRI